MIPGVCLFVCLLASSCKKTANRIFMKISTKMYLWTRKIRLNFGIHSLLNHEPKTEELQLRRAVHCLPVQTATPVSCGVPGLFIAGE